MSEVDFEIAGVFLDVGTLNAKHRERLKSALPSELQKRPGLDEALGSLAELSSTVLHCQASGAAASISNKRLRAALSAAKVLRSKLDQLEEPDLQRIEPEFDLLKYKGWEQSAQTSAELLKNTRDCVQGLIELVPHAIKKVPVGRGSSEIDKWSRLLCSLTASWWLQTFKETPGYSDKTRFVPFVQELGKILGFPCATATVRSAIRESSKHLQRK